MPQVELTNEEWSSVMGMISNAPWRDANPLLMKIGEQLRQHQMAAADEASHRIAEKIKQQTNSSKTPVAEGEPVIRRAT